MVSVPSTDYNVAVSCRALPFSRLRARRYRHAFALNARYFMNFHSSSRPALAAFILHAVIAGPVGAQPAERAGDFTVEVRADSITGQDRSFATLWPEGRVFGMDVDAGPVFVSCGRDSAALSAAVMLLAYGTPGDTLPVVVRLAGAAPDTLLLEGEEGSVWFLRDADVAPLLQGALQADSLFIQMLNMPSARYAYGLQGVDTVLGRLGCAAIPPASGRLAGRRVLQDETSGMVQASAMVHPRLRPGLTGDFVRYLARNYPRELWDARVEGRVSVRLRVTEDGSVDSATVTRSSNEAFDAAALEAVRRLCFDPATAYGRRVKVWVELPINFTPPDRRPPARPENAPPPACPPPRG